MARSIRRCLFARTLVVVAGLALGLAPTAVAQPLTNAFTYQGELLSGGVPATGSFDIRFALFTAGSGGTQVGTTQCADNVNVVNGKFSVTLDFGAAYPGDQRFIELQVRDGALGTCASSGGFTILAPRQSLTATPYASTSLSAINAAQLGGNPASFYTNAANLSSGTVADTRLSSNVPRLNAASSTFTGGVTAPTFTGALNGNAATATSATNATNATNLNGQPGSFYQSASNLNAGTLSDARLSSNVALRNATNIFSGATNNFSGEVGIGLTSAPLASLHVRGDSNLGSILLTPNVADANTQFVFSENTGATNAFIARYNGAATNNLELIGRSAGIESTPILTVGRDSGIVTVGNATETGRVNIIGGAVALSLSSTGTGDGTVLLPASSVGSAETSNEAGFDTNPATSALAMDINTSTTLRSVTINAPTDGFAIVMATVQVNNNNALTGTEARLLISSSSTANAETDGYEYTNITSNGSRTITIHSTFPVTAGSNTFYVRGWTSGLFVEASRRRITAIFLPTQYQ